MFAAIAVNREQLSLHCVYNLKTYQIEVKGHTYTQTYSFACLFARARACVYIKYMYSMLPSSTMNALSRQTQYSFVIPFYG